MWQTPSQPATQPCCHSKDCAYVYVACHVGKKLEFPNPCSGVCTSIYPPYICAILYLLHQHCNLTWWPTREWENFYGLNCIGSTLKQNCQLHVDCISTMRFGIMTPYMQIQVHISTLVPWYTGLCCTWVLTVGI